MRLVVVAAAAIGLILFVAFVVSRLLQARTRGLSIRMQVFLALAVIVGAFAFGLGIMVIDRVEARASMLAQQAAQDEARAIAGIMEGEMDRTRMSVREIAFRLEQERKRGADLRLELLDPEGRVLFPRGQPSAQGTPGSVTVDAPLRVQGNLVGAIRVVKPTVVMRAMLEDFAPTVLVISLVLGAAAALAAAWIGRAIAAPIERLSEFSERLSTGERLPVPQLGSGREVTRLVRSIDSMRRQLEGRPFVETFAADLSHELKNPVAAIRASAEVLEESALEEPEQARRFVARIREATERIERLLSDLLSLARIEARGAEAFEPVDLAKLSRLSIDAQHERRARIRIHTEGDARVRGDPTWITRAINNLLDNALVHSEPGSLVRLNVSRYKGGIVLSVQSRGTLSKHVRQRLFRRFVTTRPNKGGSGLGLAIVRAVAEAHGGRVELMQPGPPDVEFWLWFPPARGGPPGPLPQAIELDSATPSPGSATNR
ncbi:MAG TPA: histidine kinase dimerization/phospho-acceptor domain-containing protein [Polyangiaceae bacterium]